MSKIFIVQEVNSISNPCFLLEEKYEETRVLPATGRPAT